MYFDDNTQLIKQVRNEYGNDYGNDYANRNWRKARNRRNRIYAIAIVLCLLLAAGIAILLLTTQQSTKAGPFIGQDSGVAACQQIASSNTTSNNSDSSNLTKAEYLAKKATFTSSKYADIRVAGGNVMDTVYKMGQADSDDLGTAMAQLTTIEAQWGQLQTACANHGVTIPSLSS